MTYIPIIKSIRISEDYGYTCGGYITNHTPQTERYDYVNNTWTLKTNMNTSRYDLSGFELNGYGYSSAGYISAVSNVTEKYDVVNNTWTAKTNLNTGRNATSSYNLHGFGYTAGGNTGAVSGVTEKYDDINNTWTARTNTTARKELAGFSLDGYGYSATGYIADYSTIVEKYDDINNTWTAKAAITNARRYQPVGWTIDEYGYVAGGYTSLGNAAKLDKYDPIANSWTNKTSSTGAYSSAGFSVGSLKIGKQNPELYNIISRINRELVPVDQTASRAINGTVYTNNESSNLFITVSASCVTTVLTDNAYMQAFSDSAADPVTTASGIVGIESGLAGEKISVQLSFIVRPTYKYKVVQTLTAGSTITIGKWFETILK